MTGVEALAARLAKCELRFLKRLAYSLQRKNSGEFSDAWTDDGSKLAALCKRIEVATALRSPAVIAGETPEGWKLVPVEPTQDMLDAGYYPAVQGRGCKSVWQVMLAAAPALSGKEER